MNDLPARQFCILMSSDKFSIESLSANYLEKLKAIKIIRNTDGWAHRYRHIPLLPHTPDHDRYILAIDDITDVDRVYFALQGITLSCSHSTHVDEMLDETFKYGQSSVINS